VSAIDRKIWALEGHGLRLFDLQEIAWRTICSLLDQAAPAAAGVGGDNELLIVFLDLQGMKMPSQAGNQYFHFPANGFIGISFIQASGIITYCFSQGRI
jgi:hypothetical protein